MSFSSVCKLFSRTKYISFPCRLIHNNFKHEFTPVKSLTGDGHQFRDFWCPHDCKSSVRNYVPGRDHSEKPWRTCMSCKNFHKSSDVINLSYKLTWLAPLFPSTLACLPYLWSHFAHGCSMFLFLKNYSRFNYWIYVCGICQHWLHTSHFYKVANDKFQHVAGKKLSRFPNGRTLCWWLTV